VSKDSISAALWLFLDYRIAVYAGALTYLALIALFPLLFLIVSVYGIWQPFVSATDIVGSLEGVIPAAGVDIIKTQVNDLVTSGRTLQLSVGAALALLLSLWALSALFRLFQAGMNMIYSVPETRTLSQRFAVSLLFALIGSLLLSVSLILLVIGPEYTREFIGWIGGGQTLQSLGLLIRWLLILLLTGAGLSILYRFGPNVSSPNWQILRWGTVFTLVSWLLFSQIFNWYLSHFDSLNTTWGSLATVIIFLIYINISMILVLVGARINRLHEPETTLISLAREGQPVLT
jgi:membrane protein